MRRSRLKKIFMKMAIFMAWICWGALANLKSWSMVPISYIVLPFSS
jgi:hypothetical protein